MPGTDNAYRDQSVSDESYGSKQEAPRNTQSSFTIKNQLLLLFPMSSCCSSQISSGTFRLLLEAPGGLTLVLVTRFECATLDEGTRTTRELFYLIFRGGN